MDARNVCAKWPTDQELVEQSKQGDEEAIAALIGRHYKGSVRMANSILRNQPDAEDVVQMAYSRAFQKLHTFREEAPFSTPPRQAPCDLAQLGGTDECADQDIPDIARSDAGGKRRPA
jgi:hypothetical protein